MKIIPMCAVLLLTCSVMATVAEIDYGPELPRIAPVEPQAALDLFTIAAGYRLELVAHEPHVADPVAMDFDEHGRLFVVEMRGYSEHAQDHLGVVRLLTDPDGDGYYDQSTVYVDQLSWPTAILCYNGGVFIGAAPDILFCKDTNGDGRADVREQVFTGFGTSNVQGLLNSFRWGLDNRIHGSASSTGGQVRRVDQPESAVVTLRGRDFSFDPRTLEFRAESGGGQHGMCFDRWGRKFVCSNSDHLQAVLIPDRYVAKNPYYALPRARASIAVDGPQATVYRTSPVEPWRIVRTRLRVAGKIPGPVEGGGTAAGYFTSATGVTIYEGDAWPKETRGTVAIVGDVGSNIVHRKRITPHGASFRGQRIDDHTEFISSRDIWFRPVQFAHGPDGALYIADMYREVIEHPDSLVPIIKVHLDLNSGRDRGRIYRVLPADPKPRDLQLPGAVDTVDLVAMLAHRNIWHRRTASRLLYERLDLATVASLHKTVPDSDNLAEARLHAAATLRSFGRLLEEEAVSLVTDANPRVREAGLEFAEAIAPSDRLRDALAKLARDSDPRVRFQLALSLSSWTDARDRTAPTWKDNTRLELLRAAQDDPWLGRACLIASADFMDFDHQLDSLIADGHAALARSLKAVVAERERDNWKALTDPDVPQALVVGVPIRHLPTNQDAIDRYTLALSNSGSRGTGKKLFDEHCAICHARDPAVPGLGPAMNELRTRSAESIVMNVIDPNREVHPQYVSYTAETDDGRLINGLIASETASSITLAREIKEQTTLLKTRIASLQSNGKSIMPEGFENKLSPTQMNDLLAFILGSE